MNQPTAKSTHPLTTDDRSPSPLPDTPPDFSLLTDEDKDWIDTWFDHDSRLPEIAKELNTTVLELAAWSNQPHIRQAFAFIKHIAHERTDTLQAEADHQALNRLLSITRFTNHEETARRAAMNVLTWRRSPRNRTSAPPKPRHDAEAAPGSADSRAATTAPSKPLPECGVGVGAFTSATPKADPTDHPQSAISPFQTPSSKSPPPNRLPNEHIGTNSLHSSSPTTPPPKPLPEAGVGVGSFRSPTQVIQRTEHPQSAISPFQTSNSKSSSLPIPVPALSPSPCLRVSVPPCQSPSAQTEAEPRSR